MKMMLASVANIK